MKARVKHTGEWITVNPCNDGFYDVGTHDIYEPDELEFAAEFDWQSFRREAAKDLLCAIVAREAPQYSCGRRNIQLRAYEAVEWADELIKQLQEDK